MAQAARLSLRMQKELKLLLSDPPPGVSLPDAALSSISSIDADIEGPQDTVYAKGVFRVKVQIPERYPFQPPNVTFVTPVYHPNIDNGGRICLDILNLPPKGSWQPSLNISTVLTSIGLLLSEPNPDDGLMCEASWEYKYNRQAFDQKARTMTEKYARACASGNKCSDPDIQLDSRNNTEQGTEMPKEVQDEPKLVLKKSWRMSRKLSLDASSSSGKRDAEKKPDPDSVGSCCQRSFSIEGAKEEAKHSNVTSTQLMSDQTKPNLLLELCMEDASGDSKGIENTGSETRNVVDISARRKKLSLGLKGPLKTMEDNKENILLAKTFQLTKPTIKSSDCGFLAKEFSLSPQTELQEVKTHKSQRPLSSKASKDLLNSDEIDHHEAGQMTASDLVIVLDSDDSGDEDKVGLRQKGLLGRKRLRHWNSRA